MAINKIGVHLLSGYSNVSETQRPSFPGSTHICFFFFLKHRNRFTHGNMTKLCIIVVWTKAERFTLRFWLEHWRIRFGRCSKEKVHRWSQRSSRCIDKQHLSIDTPAQTPLHLLRRANELICYLISIIIIIIKNKPIELFECHSYNLSSIYRYQ